MQVEWNITNLFRTWLDQGRDSVSLIITGASEVAVNHSGEADEDICAFLSREAYPNSTFRVPPAAAGQSLRCLLHGATSNGYLRFLGFLG